MVERKREKEKESKKKKSTSCTHKRPTRSGNKDNKKEWVEGECNFSFIIVILCPLKRFLLVSFLSPSQSTTTKISQRDFFSPSVSPWNSRLLSNFFFVPGKSFLITLFICLSVYTKYEWYIAHIYHAHSTRFRWTCHMHVEFWWWWSWSWRRKIDCCYIVCVSLSLVSFFTEKEEERRKKSGGSSSKKNRQRCMAGQTRCCMQSKWERETKCNARKEEEKRRERRHHHQPTPERRPTVKRQIIVRLTVMHFFPLVLCILVLSCPFYSLSLSFARARACLPLTPSSPVRCSRLALCLSLSLSFRTHAYTRTRSVCKDTTK